MEFSLDYCEKSSKKHCIGQKIEESIPFKVGNRKVVSIVTTFIQHCIGSPSKKRNKSYKDRDEEKNLIFPDDMIIYIENSKGPTDKLLELIRKFSTMLAQKM